MARPHLQRREYGWMGRPGACRREARCQQGSPVAAGCPESHLRVLQAMCLPGGTPSVKRLSLLENNLAGVIVFAMGVSGLFIAGDWAEQEQSGWLSLGAVVGLVMSIGAFVLAARMALAGVEVLPGEIRIRNFIRTRRFAIPQIRAFRLTRSRWLASPKVVAELEDGTEVRVTALGPGPLGLFRQAERVEAMLGQLNSVAAQFSDKGRGH